MMKPNRKEVNMKKIALLLCFVMLFALACNKTEAPAPTPKEATTPTPDAAKADTIQKIHQQLRGGETASALAAIEEAITQYGIDDFYGIKALALHQNGRSEEALALVDQALEAKKGERPRLLSQQHEILVALNRLEEALSAIQTMDSESERKSPWTCLTIAGDQMKLSKPEEALKTLEMAVERGMISKSAIEDEEVFKPLLELEGFKALLEKMNTRIGLGAPAKAFTLRDIKDRDVSLESLKGKVVLLDFWATWCPPCREEIPNLKAYYTELKEKGLEIVGISLDKNREALDKYLTEQGMDWIITYSGKMWQDETVALYGVNSIPSTWLIDKKGILRHFDLRSEELKGAIIDLLGEK